MDELRQKLREAYDRLSAILTDYEESGDSEAMYQEIVELQNELED